MHRHFPGEIRHDDQIESFWVSLYFLSRNRAVLICVSVAILTLSFLLAWILRVPDAPDMRNGSAMEVAQHELASEKPSFKNLAAALPALAESAEPKVREFREQLAGSLEKSKLEDSERVALSRYWASLLTEAREPDAEMLILAHQPTPLPRANELVADFHARAENLRAAIPYLQREVQISGADSAHEKLVDALLETKEIKALSELGSDPAFSSYFTPLVRLQIAREVQSWPAVLMAVGMVEIQSLRPLPLALSIIAGLAWFAIALQAIQPGRVVCFRTVAPAFAVLAGILSTWPARFIAIWLADHAGVSDGGTFLGGLLYTLAFAAPVEECAKLLFAVPFLPFLIQRGSRLEMLVVCGCVGLGFAIENTMQNYQNAGPADAFGKLLTANFFHFAATGLTGLALCEFVRTPGKRFLSLAATLFGVSIAHGMYDGFMAVPGARILSAASILSFMALSLVFFHVLRGERDGVTDQLSISATLLCGMTVLTGTMLVCAASQLGFFTALTTLAANAAGLIVVVWIFFYQFGRGMSAVDSPEV